MAHNRRRWLLPLAITCLLAAAFGAWWVWWRVPELRLVGRYNSCLLCTYNAYGFFVKEIVASNTYAIVSHDWSGGTLGRSLPMTCNDAVSYSSIDAYTSPDAHWVITRLPGGDQTQALWSIWHNGSLVREEQLPCCDCLRIRNDGTAWLLGNRGNTFYFYAIQPQRTLATTDHLAIAFPGPGVVGQIELPYEIVPVYTSRAFVTEAPGSLSADGTTLILSACRWDTLNAYTLFPAYLTYHFTYEGDHLGLKRLPLNTVTQTKHTIIVPGGCTFASGVADVASLPSPPTVPPQANISALGGPGWTLPVWQTYPDYWTSASTSDGRYAVACYEYKTQKTTSVIDAMNQWFARWHLPASHQGYRRQTYLLDLYERPGILRGRAHLPRSEIQPSCLFAPNGRDIIVSIWYTVLLYHR